MRFLASLVVVGLLVGRVALGQQYKAGDEVVVIRDTNLRVPSGKVDNVWPGLVLRVEAVNGKFLWVSHGKPGWVDSAHVLPLGRQAIEALTTLIRAKPNDATLYSGRADSWRVLGELDFSLRDHNDAIRLDQHFAYFHNRGSTWLKKGDADKAIADYDEAIRLMGSSSNDNNTDLSRTYNNRGNAWKQKGELNKAITDYTESIRADPNEIHAYKGRGNAWRQKGFYDKALADYDEVGRIDPKHADLYLARAWLKATCIDPQYRDGKQAVEDAIKACELAGWKRSYDFGTLAAAYAESGDFIKAVEYQEKANALYATDKEREAGNERLALYREKKPYREEPNAAEE